MQKSHFFKCVCPVLCIAVQKKPRISTIDSPHSTTTESVCVQINFFLYLIVAVISENYTPFIRAKHPLRKIQ